MRLIDADALFERTAELEAVALEQVAKYEPSEDPVRWHRWSAILTERTAFKYDLIDAPIIEAEPVRHGRWEIYDTYKQTIDGRTFDGWCECSECRTMYPWDFSIYNYCPHCGAKMDGGGEKDGEIH